MDDKMSIAVTQLVQTLNKAIETGVDKLPVAAEITLEQFSVYMGTTVWLFAMLAGVLLLFTLLSFVCCVVFVRNNEGDAAFVIGALGTLFLMVSLWPLSTAIARFAAAKAPLGYLLMRAL